MKKKRGIFVLLVVALLIAGVAVAYWINNIRIGSTAHMASMTLVFDNSEPLVCTEFHESGEGLLVSGELCGENVGETTCCYRGVISDPRTENWGYEEMIITINNAYPSYRVHVAFTVHNIGSIPVDISEFVITDSTGVLTWDNNKGALVDDNDKPIINIEHVDLVGERIGPCEREKSEFRFLIMHDAQENYTYRFEIAIVYTQWGQTMENSQQTLEAGGGKPYATIQAAIDNASPNDSILVYPGTYKEDVTVDVENLTLIGVGGPVLDASGCDFGFSVQAAGVTIDSFTVINANMDDSEKHGGIDVYGENIGGGSVTIRNNVIGNNGVGIFFFDNILNSAVTIENNSISNNNYGGIRFDNEGGIVQNSVVGITGNTIDNNGHEGIISYPSIVNSVVGITGNTIDNNGYQGIYFYSSIENSEVEVTGNTIDSNSVDGIRAKVDATGITVNNNNIVNNIGYGVNNQGTGILNAENNWWGGSSGPSGVGPGTGDAVSANVYYEPWLDAPYPTGW